jgi:hypothetical protein
MFATFVPSFNKPFEVAANSHAHRLKINSIFVFAKLSACFC